ncbi:MAG: hemerythrin domain-containing protein [Planctomycetes bacterium]|nr:hemerythrin domain-containing protein [Planctomycetota bacterium]
MADPFSLDDFLAEDHKKIDEYLIFLVRALEKNSADAARPLQTMAERLDHHMEWEEKVLFPAVPPSPRLASRHVESLTIDHERIRRVMNELASAISHRQFSEACHAADDLRVFLQGHNRDEEYGIYVEADRVLGASERRRMAESFGRAP